MRFGEMAGLKWAKVDFRLGVIRVRETWVIGNKGDLQRLKRSTRDINILPPVRDALKGSAKRDLRKIRLRLSNQYGKNIDPMS